LLGIFNRTILLIENGLKPVWVFDGKPPTKKNGELDEKTQDQTVSHLEEIISGVNRKPCRSPQTTAKNHLYYQKITLGCHHHAEIDGHSSCPGTLLS
jgi:5'-3' exonuclease